MTLKCTPPFSWNEITDISPQEMLICVPDDNGGTWLVVTAKRIALFQAVAHSVGLAGEFRMNDVAEFRIANAIGSGLLQLRMSDFDEGWLDLVRFSNRTRFLFERVLVALKGIQNGTYEAMPTEALTAKDPHRCARCDLMLEFPGESCPRCIQHGAALSRMLLMLRPYWKATLLMLGLLCIGIAVDMVWPLLTRYLVDHVLTYSGPDRLQPALRKLASDAAKPQTLLVWIVCGLALAHILRGLITVATGALASRVGNALTFDIRGQLVRKLQSLGLSFYGKQETGALVGRVAYDTEAVQSFISEITSGFLMQLFLVMSSFVLMFSLAPKLALLTLAPTPFVLGGAVIYWRYVHPRYQRHWDRSAKQAGLLNGILSGIRVVKAFGQEENQYNRFQNSSTSVRVSREALDRTSAYFYPLMSVVFQAGGWIVWYAGGSNVLKSEMSLGTLMAFFGYLSMFYGPLGSLTNLTTWLSRFSTQVHRIFEILDAPAVSEGADSNGSDSSVHARKTSSAADDREPAIEFKNVQFGYQRGSPVLRDFNLKIPAGSRIGIVGRSGSGKTSILNLICRFYDVDSGHLLLGGRDIRELSRPEIRDQISLVLQEPFLFRGTFSENIRFGRVDAPIEEVLEAARAANAHDFIVRHALGYDTSLGERGFELSGGERQRVSIARALLCKRPLLLLDEATSSIDTESESNIRQALESLAGSNTMLIIAHRLSTVQNCDRIIVVDSGRILESGTHSELMKSQGQYAEWIRMQQGERALLEPEVLAAGPKQELQWLDPVRDRVTGGPVNQVSLHHSSNPVRNGIHALRCFPIQHPQQFISIRWTDAAGKDRELGIIRDLAEWPADARRLIGTLLERRYLFETIERIHSVRHFAQFFSFSARTRSGIVDFVIRDSSDASQDFGKKGKLLTDVENNHYLIPDLALLPRSDREIFQRQIYW